MTQAGVTATCIKALVRIDCDLHRCARLWPNCALLRRKAGSNCQPKELAGYLLLLAKRAKAEEF